jgi:hypothetical protein
MLLSTVKTNRRTVTDQLPFDSKIAINMGCKHPPDATAIFEMAEPIVFSLSHIA